MLQYNFICYALSKINFKQKSIILLVKVYPLYPLLFSSIHYSILPSVYILHPLSQAALPECGASVYMFLIGTLNHCPKLQSQQDTQILNVSKGLSEDSFLYSVSTQTYCTHSFSSPQHLSHILSDAWHWLFITALVKEELMVSCATEFIPSEWTVLSQLLHQQRITLINNGVVWMWNLNQALHACPHWWSGITAALTWGGSYATSTLRKDEERVIWPWVSTPLTDVPWTECDNET